MGIVERYNRIFTEIFYRILNGKDLLITFPLDSIQYESLETLIKDLPNVVATIVEDINNSITCHLGISPAEAIKRKNIISKPSYPRDGPVGFDEEKISGDVFVRYLLYPNDQKGGRRRAGDLNWSPHIYHICQSMVQKNQPVLYWLEEVPFGLIDNDNYILKRPERSFVREELLEIVSYLDTEFQRKSSPTWISNFKGNQLQRKLAPIWILESRNRLQIGYWNPANFIIFFAGKSALNCTRILQEIGSKLDTGIPQILLFFLQGNQLQIVLESCRNRLRFGYQSHRKLAPKLEYRIPGKSAKSPRSGFRRTGKPIDKFRSSILKVHGFLRGISKVFGSLVSVYLDGILKGFGFLGGISKVQNTKEIGSELANPIGNRL
ncbi:unnamed protein product [Rhizophagus irregularis]|nr:unnamed protein product [Rhizophagus irregularis]